MNPLDEYNPEEYDDDTLNRDDGWRCLVFMETIPGRILPEDLGYYDDDDGEWRDSGAAGTAWISAYAGITYRTQADLPRLLSPISPLTGMPAPTPSDDPLDVILKMVKP